MIKNLSKKIGIILIAVLFPYLTIAQTAGIYIGSTDQTIRGFGGMNFPRWIDDLSTDQVDKAFGNGYGQIGLSILRISVAPNSSNWGLEVPTAQRAASHGAIVFATPWSPPASMKTNGSTTQGELRTDAYDDYAQHLTDFTNYMGSNGVSLYAISVQNEPDFLPEYESCGWSGSQIRTFLDNNASIIPTRVIAPETVHYKESYMSAIESSSQVDILANHAYGGVPTRYNSGKEQWMTEHYAPNSNANSANNWPEALEVGEEIHEYLTNGYNAYVWWYIRRSYGLITEDGNVSKRGFVMSHYSKFVRPGYVRVRADDTPTSGVRVSSYRDGNTLVIVAINQNSSSRNITFDFSGNNVNNITKWETTGTTGHNVSEIATYSGGTSLTNSLTGHSITTFRGTIGGSSGGSDEVWLEAECGSAGSLWNTSSSESASNGEYVTVQSGNNSTGSAPGSSGQINYNFDVSESGNYTLWGRVIAPNANDDSFWIRMDGGSWTNWNNIAPGSTSWTWDDVTSYSLSAGNHTLTVAYREDGGQLDKLYLGSGTPSGSGGSATNCGGGSGGMVYQLQNRGTGLFLDGMGLTTNGDACGQYANTTHPNSQWEFVNVGSGYTQLRNVGTGLYLDGMGLTTNGADVGQWANTTHQNSHWSVQQYDGNYYRLQNRATGLYLDGMGRTANGDACGQYANTTHVNAQWQLISVSGARVAADDDRSERVEEEIRQKSSALSYPNPVEDFLNVRLNENEESAKARIINYSGKLMMSFDLTEFENRIDVSSLSNGVYFLEVVTPSGTHRSKLIKE